jgi:uncharacterized membrane protein YphA (DoxX/SURF4 family)
MNVDKIRNGLEVIIGVTFLLGIFTASSKLTLAGFTPMIWFLISIQTVLVTICVEITTIRQNRAGRGEDESDR